MGIESQNPINPDESPIEIVRELSEEEIKEENLKRQGAINRHPSSHPEHGEGDPGNSPVTD